MKSLGFYNPSLGGALKNRYWMFFDIGPAGAMAFPTIHP